ncbi:NAD-dependent epimerase/dehydratase family protein [Shivajiella indica]|uniref:NAD-dependent epimerase/dehydratase family protein n=1 Tax=Shivajiella indica TaxID=872115 RepID=A0ABW5B6X1_9BACT
MKIFISGASGYLGQKLAWKLADSDNKISVLIRNPKKFSYLNHPNITIFQGDVMKLDDIRRAILDCEHVYHLAALVNEWSVHPNEILKTNVEGTKNMLQVAEDVGVEKFIQISASCAIGPSLVKENKESTPRWSSFNSTYEISKFLADKEVLQRIATGFPGLIVYPTRVFGPGVHSEGALVNRIIGQFLKNKVAFVPQEHPFINNYAFIDDVVNGIIKSGISGKIGEKYILGGENIQLQELFRTIKKINKNSGWIFKVPMSALQAYSWTAKQTIGYFDKDKVATPDMINNLKQNFEFNSTKASKELNYQITPFDLAMEKTISAILNKPVL